MALSRRLHVPCASERVRGAGLDGPLPGGGAHHVTLGAAERRLHMGSSHGWWAMALLPLALLGGLILLLLRTGPADALKPKGVPVVERLAITRLELTPNGIVATVLNDGPDPVTIAQVQVDDAYWQFTVE